MKSLELAEMTTVKKSKATIIGLSIAGALLLIGVVAVVVGATKSGGAHNWDLGLAPQKSDADIAKVQKAVESVESDAVLDIYVSNANTSGTPFGHSIRINVLADTDLLPATDEAAINALATDITRAVQAAGVKDTYDLTIGLDVNSRATSGSGTSEEPAESAKQMFGADRVYSESFEVR